MSRRCHPLTRKPPYHVEIDWENPITEGLIHAIFFNEGISPIDLVQGQTSWQSGDRPTVITSQHGGGLNFIGPSNPGVVLDDISVTDELTVFVLASHEGTVNFNHVVSRHPGWFLTGNGGSLRFATNGGSEVSTEFNSATAPNGEINTYCGVYDGTTQYAYQNGILENSASQSGSLSLSGLTRVGQYGGGGFAWQGAAYLALVFKKAKDFGQQLALYNNPDQVLRPRYSIFPQYVPAAVGGATIPIMAHHYRNQGIQ